MRSIGSDLDPLALNSSGERLMIVDVLVHDETLFALLGWYAPSPESEEPGTDVLDCRLELVRMSLADGEIAGSLALADKAVVVTRVLGMGGSLTRMSDGAILVTNTVGQPRFALAVVVDPDSMTARLDAASVVDAPKGSYTLEHLGEGVLRRTIWDERNQPTSRILVDMRSGERIEAEHGGLLWSRSVGADASGHGELVCWDPADGAEIGRIAVAGGVGLAGLSAWGYWTTTAFVPATAWREGVEEWKNAVA